MDDFTTSLIGIKLGSEYGVLYDQFLCFDPRFDIRIEKLSATTQVKIAFSQDYVEGFFGRNVVYVTGIVGKNGVGKSTTLRYLKELFIKEQKDLDEREQDIVFFKDGPTIKVYINQHARHDIEIENFTTLPVEEIYFRDYPKVLDRIKNLTTIYYSNSLETDYFEKESINYFNVSTGYLKEQVGKINHAVKSRKIRNLGGLKRFRYTELKRQIEFLNAFNNMANRPDIPFKRIAKIGINIHALSKKDYVKFEDSIVQSIQEKLETIDLPSGFIPEFVDRLRLTVRDFSDTANISRESTKRDNLQIIFYDNLTAFLLRIVLDDLINLKLLGNKAASLLEVIDVFREVRYFREDELARYGRLFNRLKEIFESVELDGKEFQHKPRPKPLAITEKLKDIEELEIFFRRNWMDFNFEKHRIIFETSSNIFLEFFNQHYSTALDLPFLTVRWPSLSAGEESLIAYFSRLFAVLSEIRSENVLMLIDEGDLYFHPEWQRDYVYFLLEFLNSTLIPATGIHLILTTHSPFIVSDLPKENIILLSKEEQEFGAPTVIVNKPALSTLGGNIHTLFTETFFLGESTVSSFAKKKINESIIQPIVNGSIADVSHLRQLIARIGEPVLRNIIEERLAQRLHDTDKTGR
jgi:predicted ATP-binding protein involved in virulence